MWLVTPLSRIQKLNEEINLLSICVVMLEGIIETWLKTLPLNLDCYKGVNNDWYCLGVKL